MKSTIRAAAAAITLIASSAAHAQQAVQWKVSDGGNGHWYALRLTEPGIAWATAQSSALSQGGHLATLTSAEENSLVFSIANIPAAFGGSSVVGPWLGGAREGPNWSWVTGEKWGFANWLPPNPDGPGTWGENRTCLTSSEGRWNDFNDSGVQPGLLMRSYIVEWSADCNGDGIVDYGQILDDYLSDLDGDNIPDCCEQGVSCGQFGSGMEAYFGFDGDCLDASGNGRHGLSTGLGYTRGPAGLPGTAAAFDGLLSDVRIEGVPIPTNNAFSWALWLRADAVAESVEGAAIVERIESIGNNLLSPSLFLRPDGALGFGSYSYSSGGTSVETAPNTVTAGSWFHVACTSAQSGLRRVYVNGMLVGENLSVDYGQPLPMILIGRDRLDCCSRFRGAIDDLRFYSRPLTSAEVDALYRAASICPGDITNGGTVDAADLSILLAAWGTNGQAEFDTDIDGSGLVDGGDLALVLSGWGPCPQ